VGPPAEPPHPQPQPEPEPVPRPPAPDSGAASPRLVPPVPPPGPARSQPPVLDDLRGKLDELGIAAGDYRIGEPAEHGWSIEKVDAGWRVGWYDQELSNPAVFGDAEDAAAFMLGKLLLLEKGGRTPDPDETPITGLRSDRLV